MKKQLRTVVGPVIIAVTIAVFAYYIGHHPETVRQLRHLPPATIAELLAALTASFFSYLLITRVWLRMYNKTMSGQESFLFNAYSSLINFFGPGQSGPVFRAAYLKKRHNLGVKQFTFALFLYLGFLAIISAAFMFIGSRPWWQTVLLVAAVGAVSMAAICYYKRRSHLALG